MSVDNPAGDGESTPVGADFETDLVRVEQTARAALATSQLEHSTINTNVSDLAEHFEAADVPPAEAITAAWFFILAAGE